MKWVKASEREPTIGDYYYCKVDTKQDAITQTIVEWYDRSRRNIVFGVDVIMTDGKSYHVKDDGGAMFFRDEKQAKKKAREFNLTLNTQPPKQ